MKAQIIKDPAGTPISVLVDYSYWQEIERILKLDTNLETIDNPLDWYGLTETTNSILNELIAYTGREELKEAQKSVPDQKRLQELEVLFQEVQAINKEPENFKSLRRMQDIISKYAPLLRTIYEAA